MAAFLAIYTDEHKALDASNFSSVSAFVIGSFEKKEKSISDNGFYLKSPHQCSLEYLFSLFTVFLYGKQLDWKC